MNKKVYILLLVLSVLIPTYVFVFGVYHVYWDNQRGALGAARGVI